ncbi:MAG: putative molybdenum carrier protein [Fibrobacteres bacterium]|nr:putative molybdenum carrier protein [Fibrobacterota bacterium]
MVERIVSGGQTGADRAALDWAIENNISHSGFCPKGRIAEDGRIEDKYNLTETKTVNYRERTELNVANSDATVIFSVKGVLSGGTKDTHEFAKKSKKPLLLLRPGMENAAELLNEFVKKHKVKILNVAGPRASKEPEIEAFVKKVLGFCFR